MAEIVKARDASGQVVAVKRILPHLCEDQQYKTMFLDESRVLAQLDHEDIIKTFEIGEVDGMPYIALEFVDGQDARMLFHRTRRNEERVPVAIACYLIAKVCEGLHHAHEQTDAQGELLGLVHRDVSLQNVLLSYDGDVKLTDFGIAMSTENVARTEVGIVKGKFGYMSPEQIKGAPLDRRSDVFAAGICLYELLTGERLFSGESDYKAVERVRNVDVAPPSSLNRQIPSSLERIVMKALAKHPRDRYQSANDMRRALLAFLQENGETAGKAELGEYMRKVFASERAGGTRADATPAPGQRPSVPPPRAAEPAARGSSRKDPTPTARTDSTSTLDLGPPKDATPLPRSASRPMKKITGPVPKQDPAPAPVAAPAPAPRPAPAPADPLTGLAAFDNLDKPSALIVMPEPVAPPEMVAMPIVQATPAPAPRQSQPRHSVPPVVPRAESIPGLSPSAFLAQHSTSGPAVAPVDMDWDDEEPPTQSRGFDEIEPLLSSGDEDVTRQVRVDESFPGMQSVVSGAYPPTLETQQRPPVVLEDTRDLDPEPAPRRTTSARGYAPVLAVVVGLLVVIVVGLRTFGSPGSATIRFSTDPHDAIVTVDGKPATSSSSPFVIAGLSTEVEHTITVSKPGFSQWSTRLRVHDTKVLDLPAITLEPQPGASPEPPKNDVPPEPVQEIAAPAPLPRSPPVAKPSTPKPPPSPTETHRQKPTSGATSSGTSSSHAAASGGGSGGRGTLRVNSRPWSRVFIDGKLIGNTPQMSILLPAGSHKLKLVNPEFKLQKTVTINIAAGQIVTQVITLQ